MALEVINGAIDATIGGSADLTHSNLTITKGMASLSAGDFSGRYHSLRHPRIRHGGGDERHRAARRLHSLRRHVLGVLRLCPQRDPALRADGRAGHLRADPRFNRARRGRADASAGRASRVVARDAPSCMCSALAMRSRPQKCWELALAAKSSASALLLSRQNLPTLQRPRPRSTRPRAAPMCSAKPTARAI